MPRQPSCLNELADALNKWATGYQIPRDYVKVVNRPDNGLSGGSLETLKRVYLNPAIDELGAAGNIAAANLVRLLADKFEHAANETDTRLYEEALASQDTYDPDDTDPEYSWDRRYWQHAADAAERDTRILANDLANKLRGIAAETSKAAEDKGKSPRDPLSKNAAAVYEILKALPSYKAMTGPEILDALGKLEPEGIYIDSSTLTSRIIPELKPYGAMNKPKIGYCIREQNPT